MAKAVRKLFIGLIWALVLVGVPAAPVTAQNRPILAVMPALVEVPLGNQVLLTLDVTGGVNVNAFDIMLNYDQSRLLLASWSHGDYLSNLSCLNEVDQPGVLELACTQVARPAVSGDGTLLTLVFDTLAEGGADVTLTEAVFADPAGNETQPARQNGDVLILGDPTYTPTRTPTRTQTPTPSPIVTNTITPMPLLTGTPTATWTLPLTMTATLAGGAGAPGQTATALFGMQENVNESTLLTETAYGLLGGLTPSPTAPGAADTPEATNTAAISESEMAPPAVELGTEVGETVTQRMTFWTSVLWAALVGSLMAIVAMVLTLIKRKKQQEKDLLL